MGDLSSDRPAQPSADAVANAALELQRARSALESGDGDLRALHEAVKGAARLTRSLAATVDRLVRYTPGTVENRKVARDLVADLRALRSCLTAGAALIDPAVDDLRDLADSAGSPTGGAGVGHSIGEPFDPDADFAARWEEWVSARPGT
ncbi:hypothetical protein BAY61_05940 [Prauserella marina]|uniref:Uncharacterized protein n=1 Tax=Prauserella marina TaxID=530584 RepID=A0A222VLL2_9PSEU|nr:hypothetical protein BAY61_05940 [Prauserella marina]PWV85767.1 hypothetical protein DES30_1011797 [Prauserella marina]SDC46089.1 hypothetical protein SAMN05421630_102195 [Prauserella marina]